MSVTAESNMTVQIGAARPQEAEAIWGICHEGRLDTQPVGELTAQMVDKYWRGDGEHYKTNDIDKWRGKILLDEESSGLIVAREGDKPVAFAEIETKPQGIFIDKFYVARKSRGQGVGSLLMEGLIDSYSGEFKLKVLSHNKLAHEFYEKHGFVLGRDLNIPNETYFDEYGIKLEHRSMTRPPSNP